MNYDKPFIGAADRNKENILTHLEDIFSTSKLVLEIGSGTGQHAVHFAPRLWHLKWQTSDVKSNLAGIASWLKDSECPNLLNPIELDIRNWPVLGSRYDGIFSSNVIHYIEEDYVPLFFEKSAETLNSRGMLVLYGPFKEERQYSSEGDLQLDLMLKSENGKYGLRDLENLFTLASEAGLTFLKKIQLPANNKLITWLKDKE